MSADAESTQSLRNPVSVLPQPAAWSALVAGYAVVAYFISQGLFPGRVSNTLNFHVYQPAMWLGLAAISLFGWRRHHAPSHPFDLRMPMAAFSIGVVHVGVIVTSGLIGGMAAARDQFEMWAYVENTWYAGTLLVGLETARTYLFYTWRLRSEPAAWFLTVGLFFVIASPYAAFESVASGVAVVETLGSILLPVLAIGVLATWFSAEAGMWASLAYRVPIVAYAWYAIVLPDLHWSTDLAVGMLAPIVAWYLAQPLLRSLRHS